MKILGLNIRRIKDKKELKNILMAFNQNIEYYKNIEDGYNFLLNDNFLMGYKNLPANTVMVYMVRDDNNNNNNNKDNNNKTNNRDNIYIRKKIKIFKAFIERQKTRKHKNVVSGVRVDRKEALKLNDYLFDYRTDPMKLEDGYSYILYKNFIN